MEMNENANDIIVVDAHSDLLTDVVRQRACGRKNIIENDYFPDFQKGNVALVVAALFIEDAFLPEMALRQAIRQISALLLEIDESPEKIMLCKNYSDIQSSIQTGKVGILLSLEGVEPIQNDLTLLRVFYELGVRIIGLTWSRRNLAASGCSFKSGETIEGGLSPFGFELIHTAAKMGMLIDISHLNDQGVEEVFSSSVPVIASHSNCRRLVNIPRNLKDEQIIRIANAGGVVGINGSSFLVAERDEDSNMDALLDHIDHIVQLTNIQAVGLGFDFCDKILEHISEGELRGISRIPFDTIKGHSHMKSLVTGLKSRKYSPEDIRAIMGGNFLRIFQQLFR